MEKYEEFNSSSDSLEPSLGHIDDDFIAGFDDMLEKRIEEKIRLLLNQPVESNNTQSKDMQESKKLQEQAEKSQKFEESVTLPFQAKHIPRQNVINLKGPRDLNMVFDEKPNPKW